MANAGGQVYAQKYLKQHARSELGVRDDKSEHKCYLCIYSEQTLLTTCRRYTTG